MYDHKTQLDKMLAEHRSLIEYYDLILDHSPPGHLLAQQHYGKKQYLHSFTDQQHRTRKVITHDDALLRRLAQKELAKNALAALKNNVKWISKAGEHLLSCEPDDLILQMGKGYQDLPRDYFFDRNMKMPLLSRNEAVKERILRHRDWGKQPYTMSSYRPEFRRVTTSRGIKVRSKSEALILEVLLRYGIDVRYEQEQIIDGITIAPDFTFEGGDRALFYWEYLGMMDKPEYATRNYRKLRTYYELGIVPGNNLILTFDYDGSINMEIIESVIRAEIIPRL